MPFINVTKRLGTKIVSPIRISRHVSFAVLNSFIEEEWPVKKICAEMEEGAICCLLIFVAIRFVCHKFENSNPCVADYVPLASQGNSVLFVDLSHAACTKFVRVADCCSRFRACSLRGLFNGYF